MQKLNDLTGKIFGRLTVLSRGEDAPDSRRQWICLCACGIEKTITAKALLSNHTKSCGCLRSISCARRNTTHGHRTGGSSSTYEVWSSMWARCSNPNHKHYKYYGGRGIMVCEEWMRFENFLADMGERPDGLTLDRRETNGHYEKDNCRWVTWDVQVENKRKRTRGEINA